MFHVAQVPVDQAAGACGIKVIPSLDCLHDRALQNDHKFKKIVKMRRMFRVRIVFHGERFLIHHSPVEGQGDNVYVVLSLGAAAVFQR